MTKQPHELMEEAHEILHEPIARAFLKLLEISALTGSTTVAHLQADEGGAAGILLAGPEAVAIVRTVADTIKGTGQVRYAEDDARAAEGGA